jgi:predicted dehydrogenase
MVDAPVRLGLIGAGRWGRNYVATIADVDGARLARLASSNPNAASLVAADCAISTDWRDVAAAPDLDGIVIATPPATHAEIAEAALSAGHAVLVEKPLTLDVAAAQGLLELAEARGAVAMVDHIYLFHPAYRALKRLADELGTIDHIRTAAGDWGPFRDDTPVLWDWGAHDVAMCLDLVGARPTAVRVKETERRNTDEGIGGHFAIAMTFPDGTTADITFSNLLTERKRYLEISAGDEAIVFDDTAADPLVQRSADGETHAVSCASTPPLTQAVTDFAAAIRLGTPDVGGLALGVDVVTVLARCQAALDG